MKNKHLLFFLSLILILLPINISYGENFINWKETIQYEDDFQNVKIQFNKALDQDSILRGIDLYENKEAISYAYELANDNTLLKITPEISFYKPSNKYEIKINKNLKSNDNKTLGNNLLAEFYINKESIIEEPEKPSKPSYDSEVKEEIYRALSNYESVVEFAPHNLNINDINSYINLGEISHIIYENPDIDLGYAGANMRYNYNHEGLVSKIILELQYADSRIGGGIHSVASQSELLKKKSELDQVVDRFIDQYIGSDMTDLEKEIIIHDYIVQNAEYNIDALDYSRPVSQDNYTAYGILVNKTAVCDGYAKAFYTLGKAAGLDVRYVAGNAYSNGNTIGHAWNIINLDGDWYTVDTTWNDPIPAGNWNKPSDYVRYDYFNVTDNMIRNSHIRDSYFSDNLPESNGIKYGRDNLYEEGILKKSRHFSVEENFILPNDL